MRYIGAVVLFFAALATVRGYGGYGDQQIARQIVNQHLGCILQRSPCDSTGRQIKAMLPDALYNDCSRCSNKQKATVSQVISYMRRNYPYEWSRIQQIYG